MREERQSERQREREREREYYYCQQKLKILFQPNTQSRNVFKIIVPASPFIHRSVGTLHHESKIHNNNNYYKYTENHYKHNNFFTALCFVNAIAYIVWHKIRLYFYPPKKSVYLQVFACKETSKHFQL